MEILVCMKNIYVHVLGQRFSNYGPLPTYGSRGLPFWFFIKYEKKKSNVCMVVVLGHVNISGHWRP